MSEILREGARFALVGLGATLVHLGTAWATNRWAGLAPLSANSLGFTLAFAVSYLGHFYWTFGRQAGHRRHFSRFLVTATLGYGLSNLIVWIVAIRLGQSFELALGTILLTVPAATWIVSRIWTFRPSDR